METEQFLETSLLPAITSLLNVTKTMATCQSKDHANMIKVVEENKQQTVDVEEAVKTLSQSVAALNKPISQLVEAMNESNRLQAEQNKRLGEMAESLTENTARLNALNVALCKETEDPGIKAIYESLAKEGRA